MGTSLSNLASLSETIRRCAQAKQPAAAAAPAPSTFPTAPPTAERLRLHRIQISRSSTPALSTVDTCTMLHCYTPPQTFDIFWHARALCGYMMIYVDSRWFKWLQMATDFTIFTARAPPRGRRRKCGSRSSRQEAHGSPVCWLPLPVYPVTGWSSRGCDLPRWNRGAGWEAGRAGAKLARGVDALGCRICRILA